MKILLVIDLQEEFRDTHGSYEKVLEYISGNRDDFYVIGTVFKNTKDSMYAKHLNWNGCNKANLESLEYVPDEYIVKSSYALDISLLSKEHSYYIVGCDADACIMATCFSLWDKEYDFHVLTNYIYTTADAYDLNVVVSQLKRNFGDCII